MTDQQLQRFSAEFLEYYDELLLSVEIDPRHNLIVYVRPDIAFEAAVSHLRESMLDTVDFEEHLDVYVYPYGSNEFVTLGIN